MTIKSLYKPASEMWTQVDRLEIIASLSAQLMDRLRKRNITPYETQDTLERIWLISGMTDSFISTNKNRLLGD